MRGNENPRHSSSFNRQQLVVRSFLTEGAAAEIHKTVFKSENRRLEFRTVEQHPTRTLRDALYAMRGVRVGEASHPGPGGEESQVRDPAGLVASSDPYQTPEEGLDTADTYIEAGSPIVCVTCLDDSESGQAYVRWPHCNPISHSACLAHVFGANGRPALTRV